MSFIDSAVCFSMSAMAPAMVVRIAWQYSSTVPSQ